MWARPDRLQACPVSWWRAFGWTGLVAFAAAVLDRWAGRGLHGPPLNWGAVALSLGAPLVLGPLASLCAGVTAGYRRPVGAWWLGLNAGVWSFVSACSKLIPTEATWIGSSLRGLLLSLLFTEHLLQCHLVAGFSAGLAFAAVSGLNRGRVVASGGVGLSLVAWQTVAAHSSSVRQVPAWGASVLGGMLAGALWCAASAVTHAVRSRRSHEVKPPGRTAEEPPPGPA
jgi:hypothetical protein